VGGTDYRWLTAIDTRRNPLVVLGEEARRKDHLLATLERIPPQLEAPPRDERESPESARTGPHAPRSRDTQEGTERQIYAAVLHFDSITRKLRTFTLRYNDQSEARLQAYVGLRGAVNAWCDLISKPWVDV
jgi:hypothetical protein